MKALLFLLPLLGLHSFTTKDNADAIVGVWKNGTGKGHIQIYKQNRRFYGKIIWLKDALDATGKPKVDRKNSDPDKRSHPLIGLVMLLKMFASRQGSDILLIRQQRTGACCN